jgi:hypothetical protein
MRQVASRGLLWVGCLTVASLVAACGDPSTPAQPWVAHVTQSTYQSHHALPAGTVFHNHFVLAGKLIDKAGHDLPRTLVTEDCSYLQSSALAKQPFDCSLVVDTGSRTYAAAGRSLNGLFGTLTSTGGEKPAETFTITELGSSKQGSVVSYTIRISAHP